MIRDLFELRRKTRTGRVTTTVDIGDAIKLLTQAIDERDRTIRELTSRIEALEKAAGISS